MNQLLKFEEGSQGAGPIQGKTTSSLDPTPPVPATNPYAHLTCPSDIYNYLLPDGSPFGLFSDPYATMVYYEPNVGARNGMYWLDDRLADHSFTEREIKLLEYLSEHRVATRNQIQRVVFPENQPTDKVFVNFLKKCRQRGIICAFSWTSPIQDGRKKPLIYGLTRAGAEAVQILFHKKLKEDFWFHPIVFSTGRGPNMNTFFLDLVANELFSELIRIDRLISWQRRPQIRLSNSTFFYPAASIEVIKEAGDFKLFWLETIRPGTDWVTKTKRRFIQIQDAYTLLPEYQKPARLIAVVDGEARIPFIAKLADLYMPDIQIRYTTDERLLQGLSKETFIQWVRAEEKYIVSNIPFLQSDYPGMKATEYFSQQSLNVEEELFDE
ncbi:replication-relaxation family protein [Brevibacillus sp. 179-C9.3 HS]|uniref:replication-relaxation family protein n=2 Tax=Brevibacillus TaxID=55080 RepID=UPI0039A35FA2